MAQRASAAQPDNKSPLHVAYETGILTERNYSDASFRSAAPEKPYAHDLSSSRSHATDAPKQASGRASTGRMPPSAYMLNVKRNALNNAAKRAAAATTTASSTQNGSARVGVSTRRNDATESKRHSDTKLSSHEVSPTRSDVQSELRQLAPKPQSRLETSAFASENIGSRNLAVAEKPSESETAISKYIQRFREAPPTSRAERERTPRDTNFWWNSAAEELGNAEVDVDVDDGDFGKLGDVLDMDDSELEKLRPENGRKTSDNEKQKEKENDVSRSGDYLETHSNAPAVSEDGVSSKQAGSESTESDVRARAENYFTNERSSRPSAFGLGLSPTSTSTCAERPASSARHLADSDSKKLSGRTLGAGHVPYHASSTPVSPANRLVDGQTDILQRWRLRRRVEAARHDVLTGAAAAPPVRRALDFAEASSSRHQESRIIDSLQKFKASLRESEAAVEDCKVVSTADKQIETDVYKETKATRNEETQTESKVFRTVEAQASLYFDLPPESDSSEANTFRSVADSVTPRSARNERPDLATPPPQAAAATTSSTKPATEASVGSDRVIETIAETVSDLLFGPSAASAAASASVDPRAALSDSTTEGVAELAVQPSPVPPGGAETETEADAPKRGEQLFDRHARPGESGTEAEAEAEAEEDDGSDDAAVRAGFDNDPILQYLLERRRRLAAHLQQLESNPRVN